MNVTRQLIGQLDCVVVEGQSHTETPELLVILCHGFGAGGDDLVPLGRELLRAKPQLAASVRFVFPAAPLALEAIGYHGSRAWWMLDVAELNAAIETGTFRDLSGQLPDGMPEASRVVSELVTRLQDETGLPASRIVLGGFSQGAMVTTDVALRMPDAPAALCVLSGTLVCESVWTELASARGSLRVLQSHGRQDPILPYRAAEWLRDMLCGAGFDVDFVPFNGVHTIPLEALKKMAELLDELCS